MLLAIVFILLMWQIAAWSLPSFLMPGVPEVAARLVERCSPAVSAWPCSAVSIAWGWAMARRWCWASVSA
jgi:hypothetical protein